MKTLLSFVLIALFPICGFAGSVPQSGSWTYIPPEGAERDRPWRLVFSEDCQVESQTLFAGIRSSQSFTARGTESEFETVSARGEVFRFRKDGDTWILRDDHQNRDIVFVQSSEWDARFAAAPPVPTTKAEAIATLHKLVSPEMKQEISAMTEMDLFKLHFGMGMTIRNAFGLWSEHSPLLKDLGGGHPDDASMILIKAFWEDLKKEKAAEPGATDNPDYAQRLREDR